MLLVGCGGGTSGVASGGRGGDQTPQITSLSPTSATAGGAAFILTVNGSGFVSSSSINWNGTALSTTFHNGSVLTSSISAGEIASSGSAIVTVVNPASFGSIISNAVNFPINPVQPSGPPAASVVALVSVASDGTQGNHDSSLATINATGRFVAFSSLASNFSSKPTNGFENVFLRDNCTGMPAGCVRVTVPLSVAPDGSLGNGDSGASVGLATIPAISADGRFIAFTSAATNLVASDTNGSFDVFLRDNCNGAPSGCTPSTIRISVASDGSQSNGNSFNPSISADGRFVAFDSNASNLVPNDTNAATDIFLRDTCIGAPAACVPQTVRLSVASDGSEGNDASSFPALSANGRFVAFQSFATNLTPNNTTTFVNVFVRDTCFGAPSECSPSTSLISVGPSGVPGNNGSTFPTISADGRFIAFASLATNLTSVPIPAAINNVFVRDTCAGAPAGCLAATTLASASAGGRPGNAASGLPSISADGRLVAFNSDATNLVSGDTNGFTDIFVRDTCLGGSATCIPSMARVSVAADGTQGNFNSSVPAISADGHFVVFGSGATNLIPTDTNNATDIFLANTSF
jgi:Tol biopolymer transport system component